MERVESETLVDEVEDMSGIGEFSEQERRRNCPLLRRKCILLLLWENYWRSNHRGLSQPGFFMGWDLVAEILPAELLVLICRPSSSTKGS